MAIVVVRQQICPTPNLLCLGYFHFTLQYNGFKCCLIWSKIHSLQHRRDGYDFRVIFFTRTGD